MRYSKIMILSLGMVLSACATSSKDEMTATPDATVCEDPRPQICTMDYRPVCATLSDGSTKTYANGCGACADINVQFWVEDACPE